MSVWQRVRAVLTGSAVLFPRRPEEHEDREGRARTERALTKAQVALARRRQLDDEVDRVERYLRGERKA